MNSKKVKEIKDSIRRKINRAEKVSDDLINCISVDALKMYLTYINELESENESCHEVLADLKTIIKQQNDRIAELEKENKTKSDCAFMTSSIGNLPMNSIGLRRAVDEIARLQTVEAELQELNAKYYNEAKDSRRKIKILKEENDRLKIQLEQANCGIVNCSGCALVEQQAIKEFAKRLYDKYGKSCSEYYPEIIELTHKELDDLLKEYGIGETNV